MGFASHRSSDKECHVVMVTVAVFAVAVAVALRLRCGCASHSVCRLRTVHRLLARICMYINGEKYVWGS